jgi:uncharacterized protein (DUF433 family)
MRGGVTVNDLLDRYGHEEREAINEIIKENVEASKKAQMPLL